MDEKRVCSRHYSGCDVIYTDGKRCPLCRMVEQQKQLVALLVNRGVLPTPPKDHSWCVVEDGCIKLLGPNWGMCCTPDDAKRMKADGGDVIVCNHPPFDDVQLPEVK